MNEKIGENEKIKGVASQGAKARLEFDLDDPEQKELLEHAIHGLSMHTAINSFRNMVHYRFKHRELTDEAEKVLAEIKEIMWDEFKQYLD